MKIAIVAGGGGHFAPALAVIQKLGEEDEALVIGRKYAFEGDKAVSLEYRSTKEMGIPFKTIITGRLQRHFSKYTVFSLLKMPFGVFQALHILQSYKPDILFSTGGYISLPVTLAAWILGIPIVIHEQTLGAGLSNKIASHLAKTVCISWKSSEKYFPKQKTVLTGNPIKKFHPPVGGLNFTLHQSSSEANKFQISNENLPFIYITGGSGGSHVINQLVYENLEKLLEKFCILHQTGDSQRFHDFDKLLEKTKSLSDNLQKRYAIEKFISPENVGSILKSAEVVVCRSGMNTVTELLYFRKPALLIPLPTSQRHEQKKNALFLKEKGLAEILDQRMATPDTFFHTLLLLSEKKSQYTLKNAEEITQIEHATDKIIEVLTHAAQK